MPQVTATAVPNLQPPAQDEASSALQPHPAASPEASPAPSEDKGVQGAPEAPQPEVTPEAPKKPEPKDPQRLALARREAAVKAREAEIKLKEVRLEERLARLEQQQTQPKPFKDRFYQDPVRALAEEGLSYDQLSQRMLSAPSAEEQKWETMEQKIARLEQELTKRDQQSEESAKKQYETQVGLLRKEAIKLTSKGDDYAAIRETGSHEAVVKLIEDTYRDEGEMLSVAEAAAEVEAYLVEEAERLASHPKILERIRPKLQPPAPQAPASPRAPTTLTHQGTPSAPQKRLTPQEKRDRAIAILEGRIKP